MTRRPFEPRELDQPDAGLDPVARELERYAGLTAGEAPHHLDDRVMAALADAPPPRRGLVALLLAPFAMRPHGPRARAAMVAATMVLAIAAVAAAGELASLFRGDQVGPSPMPTVIESPSTEPSHSPTESPTTPVTPSPSPSPTVAPTLQPTPTPRPSLAETPEATSQPTAHETPDGEDDHSETPQPTESGSSGPGGGSGEDAT